MKLKNSDNNTQVFNHPCVAQKKMAEQEPPGLVVTDNNAATNPRGQTEVPRPLPHILHILFPNNGALPYEKRQVSFSDDLLELCPFLQKENDHPHRRHSLQLLKPFFTGKHYYFTQDYKLPQLQKI